MVVNREESMPYVQTTINDRYIKKKNLFYNLFYNHLNTCLIKYVMRFIILFYFLNIFIICEVIPLFGFKKRVYFVL